MLSKNTNASAKHSAPAGGTVRVELWIPSGARREFETVIAALDRAAEAGAIDDYAVETWDRFVDLSGPLTNRERRARDRLQTFARWAAHRGDRLPGLGDPAVRGVGRMGPERVTRRAPRAVLAEYEDGVLRRVTACEECLGAFGHRLHSLDDERWEHSSGPIRIET